MKDNILSEQNGQEKRQLVPAGYTNLYRDSLTGIYYGRTKINGRSVKFSLDTDKLGKPGDPNGALDRLAKKLARLREDADHGIVVDSELTFGKALDAWLNVQHSLVEKGLRAAGSVRNHGVYKALLYSTCGTSLANEPLKRAVQNFDSLIAKKYDALFAKKSSTTINGLRALIIRAFEQGISQRVILTNPAKTLSHKPQSLDKKKEVPDDDEIVALFKWLKQIRRGTRDDSRDLIHFLCFFGCRINEAAHVLKSHVDLDPAREGKPDWQPSIHFVECKSRRAAKKTRRVPIFPDAVPLVKRLLAQKPGEEKLLVVKSCIRLLNAASKDLGGVRCNHHTFRHVFATRALEATKCDFFTVANWLGHSDGGHLLAKRYAHLNQAHSQAQARKVVWQFAKNELIEDAPVAPAPAPADALARIASLEAELAKLRAAVPQAALAA